MSIKGHLVCDYDPLFQQSITDNPWSLDISSKSWSWQPIQQQRLKDAAKTWTLQGPYHWEGTEEVNFSRGYNGSYPQVEDMSYRRFFQKPFIEHYELHESLYTLHYETSSCSHEIHIPVLTMKHRCRELAHCH